MDLIAAKLGANMAKADLVKNGQVGYDSKKTIIYNNDGERIDPLGTGGTVAKVSDEFIDPSTISAITFMNGEFPHIMGKNDLQIEADDPSLFYAVPLGNGNGGYLLMSFANDDLGIPKGTYVLSMDEGYVSRVEWGEVKPIDPKYLPGVCLPVVELTTAVTDSTTTLTEVEAAALDAAVETGSPCVIKGGVIAEGLTINFAIAFPLMTAEGAAVYSATHSGLEGDIAFQRTDGAWTACFFPNA